MERRGTLLLVDDETLLRRLVAEFLRSEGYAVVEAADGAEGVRRFRDAGPFDLVLLDLNMPVLDGVEACRRIRRERPDQRVVICSGAILPEHEAALGAMGVDHYLGKPFHPEVLVAHIERELGAEPMAAAAR